MSKTLFYLYTMGENDYEDPTFLGAFSSEEKAKQAGRPFDDFMIEAGRLNHVSDGDDNANRSYWTIDPETDQIVSDPHFE